MNEPRVYRIFDGNRWADTQMGDGVYDAPCHEDGLLTKTETVQWLQKHGFTNQTVVLKECKVIHGLIQIQD